MIATTIRLYKRERQILIRLAKAQGLSWGRIVAGLLRKTESKKEMADGKTESDSSD